MKILIITFTYSLLLMSCYSPRNNPVDFAHTSNFISEVMSGLLTAMVLGLAIMLFVWFGKRNRYEEKQ
ncbi:MAG: hypothetical protein GWO07_02715 [Candidatus Dadabacteria bacterium]|nr:hypothetical protein [Candidatus Dadabacteria bacterium]NIS07680.1 hypothetical protein [Candidatus Dadabacteria bacterium]NIV42259.1 hypothetical protein [Candidatus Dadabacteria bacterium]NIX14766.1 hypothetical protein [Candidatus Dadabacteria bacterium]NIY21307.1 hypothetical protein [Candidatus Dadabacteria bacterium]